MRFGCMWPEPVAGQGVGGYQCGVGWKLPTLAAALWVVALGVWAGVAAGPIGGPWGAVAGSVLTVLAGVVTAYMPSFRDEFRQRAAEHAKAQEALRRASELPAGGPAALLDPRRGLVGFIGRERELSGLLDWCEDGRTRGLRLVTGPGGVGKTRLSVELCARLEPRGWRWVRAGDGQEASALAAARREWPGRVLLVVDYAETRIGLGELLRAVAADAGPVRVLLLARSAGEWWDRLVGAEPAVRELLAGAGADEPLPVAVSADLSNEELVPHQLMFALPEALRSDAASGRLGRWLVCARWMSRSAAGADRSANVFRSDAEWPGRRRWRTRHRPGLFECVVRL